MCVCLFGFPWGVYNFGVWGYLCMSVGLSACTCLCLLWQCVSSSPPPARVHHFLYAEVNDLAVQSHSPVRAPSPTATGGLTNWYPAERKSRGRKRSEDEGWRKGEWSRLDHEIIVYPKWFTLLSISIGSHHRKDHFFLLFKHLLDPTALAKSVPLR